jgi:hypothetical protein
VDDIWWGTLDATSALAGQEFRSAPSPYLNESMDVAVLRIAGEVDSAGVVDPQSLIQPPYARLPMPGELTDLSAASLQVAGWGGHNSQLRRWTFDQSSAGALDLGCNLGLQFPLHDDFCQVEGVLVGGDSGGPLTTLTSSGDRVILGLVSRTVAEAMDPMGPRYDVYADLIGYTPDTGDPDPDPTITLAWRDHLPGPHRAEGIGHWELKSNCAVDLSDARGYDDTRPSWYETIQIADVDGDSDGDVLAREEHGMHVYLNDKWSFTRAPGGGSPPLSDALGFDQEMHYRSIQTGDFDRNGTDEIVALGDDGAMIFRSQTGLLDVYRATPEVTLGGFKTWTLARIFVIDADGDGWLDVAGLNGPHPDGSMDLLVYINKGGSGFTFDAFAQTLSGP